MLAAKAMMHAAEFRPGADPVVATDLEDLLDPSAYLECFDRAFASQLGGATAALPPGGRILGRLDA